MNHQKWIAHARQKPGNRVNLLCFIFDGGSAGYFAPWKYSISDDINLIPILYPAREKRKNEHMHKTMEAFVQDLVHSLAEIFQGDYAFFGYCSGSVIAYEAAVLANRLYGTQPRYGMIVSSQAPKYLQASVPQITDKNRETLFYNHMMSLPFMTEKMMHDKTFLAYYKPLFVADYGLLHTYRYREQQKLSCDLDVIFCPQDTQVERKKVEQWQELTNGRTRVIEKAGGHFLVDAQAEYIFSSLNGRLSQSGQNSGPSEQRSCKRERAATETEQKILKIYNEAFAPTKICMSDRFFQKGGDSLKAVRIVNALQAEFGITVTISDIFDSGEIRELAKRIARAAEQTTKERAASEEGEI